MGVSGLSGIKDCLRSSKQKVVHMGLSGVENAPTPREIIVPLSRVSQLPHIIKKQEIVDDTYFICIFVHEQLLFMHLHLLSR